MNYNISNMHLINDDFMIYDNDIIMIFFFKHKTAYEMRIIDWSSDVCSSDLKVVRSTHGVNCTGSCSWKIYVKSGLVTWETQQTDYPRTRPDQIGRASCRERVCQYV